MRAVKNKKARESRRKMEGAMSKDIKEASSVGGPQKGAHRY